MAVFSPKGNDSNEVRLRGEPALVKKIQAELERVAGEFKDRVTLGVSIPVASHASKIGRGGSALLDLQKKTNTTYVSPLFMSLTIYISVETHVVRTNPILIGLSSLLIRIQFPGSRQYGSFGEIENAAELADVDPKTVAKVSGSRSAVAAAIEELSVRVVHSRMTQKLAM